MRISNPKWKSLCRGTITLCMINRNQGNLLERCLSHHVALTNQIIIVDTGSTDDSITIAQKHGALVIRDPWQDDFARPRNIGIERATSDWILILDPDELIAKKDFFRLGQLTTRLQYAAFQLTTRNYAYAPHNSRYTPNPKDCLEAGTYPGFHPSTKTRFFQRRCNLRFQKCWHELLDYDLVAKGLPRAKSDIPVHHYPGEHAQKTPREKQEFYLRMGEKKLRENPGDAQAWWELSVAESIIGYTDRAIRSVEKAFELGQPNAQRMLTYYRLLKHQGYETRARLAIEKAICELFPGLTHYEPSKKAPIIQRKKPESAQKGTQAPISPHN